MEPKYFAFRFGDFSHPERSSSDVRWARIIRVSNGLVQAPPRTETDGSCGRSKKKILVMKNQKSTLRSKVGNHLWCSSSWRCLLKSSSNQNVEKPRWCCWSLPWGFPVAVMQLLDCSCAPALDPWRSKKMKQLSAGSCQWCPIFFGGFFTGWNGWMIEASNQEGEVYRFWGEYHVVFCPWSRKEIPLSWGGEQFFNETYSSTNSEFTLENKPFAPQKERGVVFQPSISGASCFREGIYGCFLKLWYPKMDGL